ncbi:acyl-CoA dehydrogenase family protein [Gordonia shandongensis]|uniref:acyl-CoA dehydrogenase family protein n=1 Tax=Gordonia shandongensis TaxID=376351 RepID=UPI001B7FBBAE|nr:acyl-CoA dehydrogenase family protein [Gordonia shandongensis]
MTVEPTDEEQAMRATLARIVGKYGHDYYARRSAANEPMSEMWDDLAAGGFLGLNVPEEYGGSGQGVMELAIVLEEMSAGGCPELYLVLTQGIVANILVRHGTPEQKSEHLPSIADGSRRIAFALTEPDAGSNSHMLSTSARLEGDEWIINGTKTFISGIEHSDYFLLAARTSVDERSGRGRLSLFLVDSDVAGMERTLVPTAVTAPERQWTLFFDDIRLPADRLVGEVNGGLRALFDGLNPERVMSAVICTGIGRYALAKAQRYVNERQVWGVPIGTHQAVAHPLASAHVNLEAARSLVWQAAARYDEGLDAGEETNMAKYAASKAGLAALDTAIQVHGGNGMTIEYGLADLWGITRLQQIAPVSTEMVLNHIAQHTLSLPRSY